MTIIDQGTDARCRTALRFDFETGFAKTRCRLKRGHNGPHEGRHIPQMPYNKIRWFHGDEREFISDRDILFAWRAKR